MSSSAEFWKHGPIRRRAAEPEIMFGQVREDTSLEGLLAKGNCICIASGGETAFDLLLGGADRVLAVDLNPAQIWLVELKVAILRELPYERAFLAMNEDAREGFRCVGEQLSPEARSFFQKRTSELKRGLQNCGKVDLRLQALGRVHERLIHSQKSIYRLLAQPTLAEQAGYYDEHWDNLVWRTMLRLTFRRWPLRLAFGSAVEHLTNEDMGAWSRELAHVLRNVEAKGNPYLSQVLLGRFTDEALPLWLTCDGFEDLRSRLDRLELRVVDIGDALATTTIAFETICLSNVLDVCENSYPQKLVQAILGAAEPGAWVVSRSFFPSSAGSASRTREAMRDLVELSQRRLAWREQPVWTDRSLFCRSIDLMQLVD